MSSMMVNTVDEILGTASVMWNALYLLHLIHALNTHVLNLEACNRAAQDTSCHVFALELDHNRVRRHIETIVAVCQSNLTLMCTNAPRSHRDKCLVNAPTERMMMRRDSLIPAKAPRVFLKAGSKNAFSAVLSTEGRVLGPCWEKLKPKGPKGLPALAHSLAHSLTERLVIYCQTTSVSAVHATHCATYCTPYRPLIRAFSL